MHKLKTGVQSWYPRIGCHVLIHYAPLRGFPWIIKPDVLPGHGLQRWLCWENGNLEHHLDLLGTGEVQKGGEYQGKKIKGIW